MCTPFCKMCKITTSLLYLFCLLYARPNWLHRQKNYDKIKNAQPRADKTPFCAGKMEKAGKTMGISHEYLFCAAPGTARYSQRQAALSGRSGRHFAGILRHHGHSGKWRKAERGCPAKPGGGHSGQYPGSAAHAGRYGSLRGRQRRRYGRGRQWSRRCGGCHAGTVRPRPAGSGGPIRSRRMTAA